MHRSIEMAIKVFTDADTETPCMYDTVLHIKVPRVHSNQITNEIKTLPKTKEFRSICYI